MTLVKIILFMPATNANSEHAFSPLRKVSPYNHVEQPPQSSYDMHSSQGAKLKQVTNDFADRVGRRSSIFGHFST